MLSDLLHELEEAETIEREDSVATKLRSYARANRQRFVEEVRELTASRESSLSDVYEALTDDEEEDWSTFLLEEMRRLFDLAERDGEPADRLAPLDGLWTYCDEDNAAIGKPFLQELQRRVRSEDATIRRKCVELMGDSVAAAERSDFTLLEDLVRRDPNWRVRVTAYRLLAEEAPDRAKLAPLSLMDRMRARFGTIERV